MLFREKNAFIFWGSLHKNKKAQKAPMVAGLPVEFGRNAILRGKNFQFNQWTTFFTILQNPLNLITNRQPPGFFGVVLNRRRNNRRRKSLFSPQNDDIFQNKFSVFITLYDDNPLSSRTLKKFSSCVLIFFEKTFWSWNFRTKCKSVTGVSNLSKTFKESQKFSKTLW